MSELKGRPVESRFGQNRVDWRHHAIDPVIVAGPWVLGGVVLLRTVRSVRRLLRGGR